MIVHYNLYPDKNWACCEHIVRFYFAECTPADMFGITRYLMTSLDKSVGRFTYSDWDWLSEQGCTMMRGACGVPEETLRTVCDQMISQIKDIIDNQDICNYCTRRK